MDTKQQTSLDTFFQKKQDFELKQGESDQVELQGPPKKLKTEPTKKKVIRKISQNWFKEFLWLSVDNQERMFCTWCKTLKNNLTSPFGTEEGSTNYRKDGLEDHENSQIHFLNIQGYADWNAKQKNTKTIEDFFNNRVAMPS
jgi:hypothetical protein